MNSKGALLVELLVAISIFVLSSLAFTYILKSGAATANSSAELTRAAYLLQAEAENIRATPFEILPALNGQSFAEGDGKISITSILSDLLQIELKLTWDPKRLPLKAVTLRSKY